MLMAFLTTGNLEAENIFFSFLENQADYLPGEYNSDVIHMSICLVAIHISYSQLVGWM